MGIVVGPDRAQLDAAEGPTDWAKRYAEISEEIRLAKRLARELDRQLERVHYELEQYHRALVGDEKRHLRDKSSQR